MLLYDAKSGQTTHAHEMENNEGTFSCIKYNKNKLLVSYEKGLRIVTLTKTAKGYQFKADKKLLVDKYVYKSMHIFPDSSIWLGTSTNGAYCFPDLKFLSQAKEDINYRNFSVTPKARISMFFSPQGENCWLATFDRGIYRFNALNTPFQKPLIQDPNFKDLITHTRFLAPWDSTTVFIAGTTKSFLFDTKTHQSIPFPSYLKNAEQISSLFTDNKGTKWFRKINDNRLYWIYKGEQKTYHLILPDKLNAYNFKFHIDYKTNHLWLFNEWDACRLIVNPKKKSFSYECMSDKNKLYLTPNDHIRCAYYDKMTNKLWFGTQSTGLFCMHINDNIKLARTKITNYQHHNYDKESLSSNFVSGITRDLKGRLWISTERGGLCEMISGDYPIFKHYTEQEGLSNNVIKSMCLDHLGHLWLGTNIGLTKFNTLTHETTIYGIKDGLPFEEFWYHDLRLPNGIVVKNSSDGICYFNPNVLTKKKDLYPIQFGQFSLLNHIVKIGERINNKVLIPSVLKDQSSIELNHNQNNFSINIDALHYGNPRNHLLQYQMLPSNKEWITLRNGHRLIRFNNLSAGKYKLTVRTTNSKGYKNKTKSLFITIHPALWNTWYAYLCYLILLSGLLYACIRFIIHLQKLQFRVDQEKRELEQIKTLNAEKARYFSNISHELKTPLTLISAPINLLAQHFRKDKDISPKLDIVQRQSKKMLNIIELAHGVQLDDAHLLKRKDTCFSMDRFILEITADFKFMAQMENKKFEVLMPNKPIFALADRSHMEKILNNLLNNAMKHTRSGDSIIINYGVKEGTKDFFLSVKDTGYGIAPDDLPHIFERYYQSAHKGRANIGGSGIGLTFTKRLIQLHKGTITAESELDKGSIFKISMAILTDKEPDDVLTPEEIRIKLSMPQPNKLVIEDTNIDDIQVDENLKNSLIYVVEDNIDMQRFLVEMLEKFYKVKSFFNGIECNKALQEEWPDLILSDIMMPEMDGYELCRAVKSNIKTSHIPIILLTACNTIDERVRGLDEGADSYIPKPFYPRHVITRIEGLLRIRQQLRERYNTNIPLTFTSTDRSKIDNQFLADISVKFKEHLLDEEIDFKHIALELGMNRSSFYKKVKVLTDFTPFELLKNYRLTHAAELLEQGDSVSDACVKSGFKSRTHFSKLFKDRYEVTPSKYIASHRNK